MEAPIAKAAAFAATGFIEAKKTHRLADACVANAQSVDEQSLHAQAWSQGADARKARH